MAPSRASRKKQTRLTFAAVHSSSPTASPSPRVVSDVGYDSPLKDGVRNAFVLRSGTKMGEKIEAVAASTKDDVSQLLTPHPSSQPQISVEDAEEGDDDDSIVRSRPSRRLRQPIISDSDGEGGDRPETSAPRNQDLEGLQTDGMGASPGLRRSTRRSARSSHRGSNGTPTTISRSLRSTVTASKISTKSRAIVSSPALKDISELADTETSSDDSILATRPTNRRQARKPTTYKDDFIVDDDRVDLISSEDNESSPQYHQGGPAKTTVLIHDSSDEGPLYHDSGDEMLYAATPSKRKKHGRLRKPQSKRARQEELQELQEDLEDLQDSEVDIRDTRTRGAAATSSRDKYRRGLEALKKSRAKRSSPHPISSDREGGDSQDDLSEQQDDGTTYQSFHALHYDDELSQTSRSEHPDSDAKLEEYEGDFIDDDETILGTNLPLEFSRWATAPPRDHFRNVVEWLVKNKVSPAFDRKYELFPLSFRKINDEVHGQAGSRYISAAWKSEFKRSLEARPELEAVRITGQGDGEEWWETCQACGRTGHSATWRFQFKGRPYYEDTLEPVGEPDDSETDSSLSPSRHSTYVDSHTNPILPISHTFPLGRTCASNAMMAHKLSHWKYHLNQYILSLLHDNGLLTPEAIVRRDGRSQKRREREAEKFVDELEESGEMEKLWRAWRAELDGARVGMEDWDEGQKIGVGKGKKRAAGLGGTGIWG